ncbi:MAG TPA: FAD-dependent monooxygenase, partial [Candidatus Polarisedimenticolaceae bacterium]|nr:FAD-dependent monooxygenase [Candidatus Polarisedimenticolaceae bacterium]
ETRLLHHKVRVQWNHRLESVETKDGGIVAQVAHLDRVATGYPIAGAEWMVTKTLAIHAKYVVGADGYHSRIREELGLTYEGLGPLQTFSVFEFETASDPGFELAVVLDGESVSACWPMSDRRCRWSFQVPSAERHDSTIVRLNELIKARAPWFPEVRGELLWASMVQFDRRLASGLGAGRLWLAGDSVHMTTPVGVQSMNAGLVDAHELSWRLADRVRGERGDDVLASYSAERSRELARLVRPDATAAPAGAPAWVRRHWGAIGAAIPATGDQLDALLAPLEA